MENDELFQAICAEPNDETLRLIYADFLEDRGDSRADFIRLQCEMEHIAEESPQYQSLNDRELEFLTKNTARWNAPLHRMINQTPLKGCVHSRRGAVRGWGYGRGFVEELRVEGQTFVDHFNVLFGLGPILYLRLFKASDCIRQIAEISKLGQIRSLKLCNNNLAISDLSALLKSPHLQTLRYVDVQSNPSISLAQIQFQLMPVPASIEVILANGGAWQRGSGSIDNPSHLLQQAETPTNRAQRDSFARRWLRSLFRFTRERDDNP